MSLPALAWRSETAPRTVPLWHDTASAREPAPPLDGDTTADLVLVGAGASGLWAAWALLDADPALEVLLIDAGAVGDGAAGRGIGAASAWTDGVHPHPGGPAVLATALLRDAVVELGGTAAAEEIDCDFRFRGALRVAGDRRGLDRLRDAADPEAEDRLLDPGALGRRVLLPGALGGLGTADCATVHPTRLLHGLADALLSRGARIAEHTRALRISPGAVVTDQGIVRAERIVQATGAATVPGGAWAPRPVREAALATAPIDPAVWERIGLRRGQLLHLARGAVAPPAGRSRDLRLVRTGDDRLVLTGPGVSVPAVGSPAHRGSAVDALRRTADRAGARRLRSWVAELFPDLAAVPVTHLWSWTRAATTGYPVGACSDGLGWIGGHGPEPLAAANLSGRVLADLLTGADGALTRATAHGWD